jgi:hypothetical protein
MRDLERAQVTDRLEYFIAKCADDSVKKDLELTCDLCQQHLCDIEAGDSLETLVGVASGHVCPGNANPEEG